jgi:hypothetical protein
MNPPIDPLSGRWSLFLLIKKLRAHGMVAHTCNPSTRETEVGGQSGCHSKTLSKKPKRKKKQVQRNCTNFQGPSVSRGRPRTLFSKPAGWGVAQFSGEYREPPCHSQPIFAQSLLGIYGLNTRAPSRAQLTKPAHLFINLLSIFPSRKRLFQAR